MKLSQHLHLQLSKTTAPLRSTLRARLDLQLSHRTPPGACHSLPLAWPTPSFPNSSPQFNLDMCNTQRVQLQGQLQQTQLSYMDQINKCQVSLAGCQQNLTTCQTPTGRR
jgi:hypothetical protein